jgi:ABC-type dipeptide/oligopeptide/nickel transport system ATPase subunit
MQETLNENQMRYIKREKEYKDVIHNIELKIQDNSTKPLEVMEEKTQDQYLAEGIDIHDKQRNQEISRKKMLQKANEIMIDNANSINPSKNIKDIHINMKLIDSQIEETKNKIGSILKDER